MEINEAPEKIYLSFSTFTISDYVTKTLTNKRSGDIEYIRTDAFIEKVKDFLYKKDDRDSYTIGNIKRHLEEIIKEIGL